MDKFETLEKAMCKEMEALEHKLQGGTEMSTADLDKIDKLAHALKSLATYKAMREAGEYDDMRHMPAGNSYADGYSRGYSEAMMKIGPPRFRY